MRLFRSEEHVARSYERSGAIFPSSQLWRLAERWYGDRLHPGWHPRSLEESQRILDEVGLTGPLWRL